MTETPRGTGEDLKRAILAEARSVLEEEGYPALSTRRIASAVGCTATSIYLYFRSKDALVHALIEEGFEDMNARLLAAANSSGTPRERLERAARAYVEFGLERTSYYEIMFMLRADQMERFPADAYRKARRGLEGFIEIAGMPRDVGLRVGTTVWASLHGLVALLIARRVDVGLDQGELIDSAIDAACTAALAAPAPRPETTSDRLASDRAAS